MSSGSFPKNLQPILITTIILGVLMTVFFVYYKPSMSWLYNTTESEVSKDQVRSTFPTKSSKNVTTLLVWFWPFGTKYDLTVCGSVFNIEGCFITADRKFYNQSDGLLIHYRDVRGDLSNLPKLERPPFQKWIWMNLESPTHSWKHPGFENLFNLTLNYRRDANINVPYGSILAENTKEDFALPSKNKLVCWIVSNWNGNHKRVTYYNELKSHIQIHAYGNAFGQRLPNQDFLPTISSCKFYLSFENSIHKDYITEKLYNPLSVGTVPVVLGPPRSDYENFVPGDAFIHINDFASAKELAEYLLQLDKNEEMYLRYFKWRRHFRAKTVQFWAEHTCKACDYLRRHTEYQAFKHLDKWYWS